MKVLTIAAQKGGAGKTTTALHLATLAQATGPTLLIDADPQGSLGFWYDRREARNPVMVRLGRNNLKDVLDAARSEGIEWVVIDTPPHDSAVMANAIRPADMVLIPARPSALDLHAIEATLRMVETVKRPALVVLSQCPPRRGFGEPGAVHDARQVVAGMGGAVADTFITSRAIAAQSVIAGLSVGEIEPNGASAQEFAALWAEIVETLNNGEKA